MRAAPLLLPIAVLLLALPLPAAANHPQAFPHVNPFRVDLGPGDSRVLDLSFNEGGANGQFEEGWVFLVDHDLDAGSAPLQVALHRGHGAGLGAEAWNVTLSSEAPGMVSGLMPATDFYALVFRNPSQDRNASMTFFYDQSCNCAAKPIPPEVPDAWVIFNADVREGATWRASFFEPAVHRLEVHLAERTDERSRWPQDFRVLEVSEEARVIPTGGRVHEIEWTAGATQRYYFFAQSVAADLSKFDRSNPVPGVMVTPLYEQLDTAPEPKPAPLGLWPLLAALGLAALGLRARRR